MMEETNYCEHCFLLVLSPRGKFVANIILQWLCCYTYKQNAQIKQLLDKVEHDIMNYQNRGVCSAEADNTDTRFW